MAVSSPVQFEVVASEQSFVALAGSWDGLVRTMIRPSPFLLHSWLLEWWRHFGRGAELAVHVAFREGRLVGAVPLFVRPRLGLRIAEFLGSRESALADVLLAEGEDSSMALQLAERVRGSRVDLVDLFGLHAQSRLTVALGARVQHIERVEAPVLDLAGGWQTAYRRRMTSKSRSLHRRRKRQLAELGTVDLAIARTELDLRRALEEAFRLHSLRWRGRPDHSSFGTPTGQAFHRAALKSLTKDNIARIATLNLDGRAIAFHYYFVFCDRMYVHRLAFDPAFARYSPGLICTLAAVEAAAAEGVHRVEFLGGGERYKLELADHLEPLYQSLGLARTPVARAFVMASVASIKAKLRLKRSSTFFRFYYTGLAAARGVATSLLNRDELSSASTSSGGDETR